MKNKTIALLELAKFYYLKGDIKKFDEIISQLQQNGRNKRNNNNNI